MPAKSSQFESDRQKSYLHDMLESAQHVLRYSEGVTFEDFWADSEKRDAISMRLSVIGEAARHVTKETAAKLPDVPFNEIRGMRNRMAHDYGHVDYRIVWKVAQEDIAPLVSALSKYFAKQAQEPKTTPVVPEAPSPTKSRSSRR